MTKREKLLIERKIEQYEKWAAEELASAQESDSPEEYDDFYIQYRLNGAAADCLRILLDELESMAKRARPEACG